MTKKKNAVIEEYTLDKSVNKSPTIFKQEGSVATPMVYLRKPKQVKEKEFDKFIDRMRILITPLVLLVALFASCKDEVKPCVTCTTTITKEFHGNIESQYVESSTKYCDTAYDTLKQGKTLVKTYLNGVQEYKNIECL